MNNRTSTLARMGALLLVASVASVYGCGGDDTVVGQTPDGGSESGSSADTGPSGNDSGGVDTGVTADARSDTGADATVDSGPSFYNPRLSVANLDTAGGVAASLHLGTSWYIGGVFTRVSPYTASNMLALETAAGPTFAKPVACAPGTGVAGSVLAIAESATSIYIGGNFTTYQGAPANRIAKIDKATCALDTTFSPAASNGFDGIVTSLAANATSIYVGGTFAQYRGVANSANRIAKLDLVTGAIDTTFSPPGATANGFTDNNGLGSAVSALALTPTHVFVGGGFSQYRGVANSANAIAKLNLTTGAIDTTFSPVGATANGFVAGVGGSSSVFALAVNANDVYVGGAFTQYKNVASSARGIAKLNLATGAIDTTFSPAGATANGFDGSVNAIAINATDVYVAGFFSAYKGVPNSANNVAKLGLTTGSIDGTFSPTGATANGFNKTARSIALTATDVYVGGDFTAYRGIDGAAIHIAKLSLAGANDNTFLPADSNLGGFTGGGIGGTGGPTEVDALLVSGTKLWLGGKFSLYGGIAANDIAKIDDVKGTVDTTFNPLSSNGFDGQVLALAGSGTSVYVGGEFNAYRGVANSARNIAKLDATSGAIDTTFSPAGAATNGFDARVSALAATATDLYVGGNFTAYKGVASSAKLIAKLNLTTGAIDTTFSPVGATANGFTGNPGGAGVLALATSATDVYVGGFFTTYRGVANSAINLAKLNLTTGAIDTTFSPVGATANGFGGPVDSIAVSATDVYAGGNFSAYKGVATSANNFAKLNLTTGAIDTAFSPPGAATNGFDSVVTAITVSGTDVYVGGQFTAYKGALSSANHIAKLNATTGAIDATFSPVGALTNGFDSATLVNSIAVGTSTCTGGGCGPALLVGGSVRSYRGAPARGMALLDPTSGAIK